jgi:hypothetical protein
VAFEILGPPRLSKLLYEAYLLQRCCGTLSAVMAKSAEALSQAMAGLVRDDAGLRQRILSIGIPILMPDGQRLLRGPAIKSADAEHGWVDLTPANAMRWKERVGALRAFLQTMTSGDTSSRSERAYPDAQAWTAGDTFDVGEIAGWLFLHEEKGRRGKS